MEGGEKREFRSMRLADENPLIRSMRLARKILSATPRKILWWEGIGQIETAKNQQQPLEEEAEGELSISFLSEASSGDASCRQVVDIVAGYNFAPRSIGIILLPFEILFFEILSCPPRNRKPRE
jgi:hypothetical protein